MASLGGDSEQEMDTREPPLSVDRADTLVLLRYRVCSLWLAGSHMQTLCIAFAEVTYNERTLSPWHPCAALRWLRWHCQTNRDRPRAWSSWALTNRQCLGRPGDLCDRPGDHRWRACNKGKKHLRTASHPHQKWKIGNFMQEKKRLRLMWLARSHRCSVNTHGKPVLIFLLANTTAEPKQVWKSYAVSPDLCVWLPYCNHRKSWTWGPSKPHGTKLHGLSQSTWKDFQRNSP